MKDKKISNLIKKEEKRQREGIELIPSENYASSEVRKVLSSYYVNKYSEGYPKKRYYGGNENVDQVEILCQERAKELFKVPFANVQPYSGSPANLAVYLATCHPGDVVSGQALIAGGHLTHGHHVSATGIYYKTFQYGLIKEHVYDGKVDDLFDYEQIKKIAKTYQPKLIWVGATAYPLIIHFEKFAKIADEIGAYLAADIAHIAGLIAAGVHPSPVPYVHIVTTTTHKTLRGPRGAMIMVTKKGLAKDKLLAEKIDRAVFPGLQGGPHNNNIAALAIALKEAASPSFRLYAKQTVKNSQVLARELIKYGFKLIGNGSENHMIWIDSSNKNLDGWTLAWALEASGIIANRQTIPFDKKPAYYPSGLRLGTPALTTRGMKEKEMILIAGWINQVVNHLGKMNLADLGSRNKEKDQLARKAFKQEVFKDLFLLGIKAKVKKLCQRF